MELMTSPYPAWFITLTYDDDSVPTTIGGQGTLRKKYVRRWLERCKKKLDFRYFVVGEYGERFGRPHYHLALFPNADFPPTAFTDLWRKGFTSTYELTHSRARYMLKDLTKSVRDQKKDSQRYDIDGIEKPFRIGSRNPAIGVAFVSVVVRAYRTKSGQAALERDGDVCRSFRFGREILPIPRFILGKIRQRLGIPALHEERLAHLGYYEKYANREFAEWEPEEAIAQEIKLNAKKKANALRKTARRL